VKFFIWGIIFILVLCCNIIAAIDSSRHIFPEDLEYKGIFRLPNDVDNSHWGGGEASTAMCFYPEGDGSGSGDGYPGSLFGLGSHHERMVSEVGIPAPLLSDSQDASLFPVATSLQPFGDLTGGLLGTSQPEITPDRLGGLAWLPAQGSQTTGKLYWSIFNYYAVSSGNYNFLGWSETDVLNPDAKGIWKLSGFNSKTTSNYLFDIPKEWADQYVGGKYLACGKAGGPGSAAQSHGPAIYATAPWNHGNPPADNTGLDAVRLLFYPGDKDYYFDGQRRWGHCDDWTGGVWITAGDKSAVLFYGRVGLGDNCYGCPCDQGDIGNPTCTVNSSCHAYCYDPCGGGKGYHCYPYETQIAFYSPDELAEVAQGTREPWEVNPYAIFRPQAENYFWTNCSGDKGTLAFDRENGLIYFAQPLMDDTKTYERNALMHVFSVAHLTSSTVSGLDRGNAFEQVQVSVRPNPFCTSVDIMFRSKNEERRLKNVEVKIYDITGKLLSSTFNIQHSSFVTTARWDAQDQPAGMYMVRVKAGDNVITKRFLKIQ
jgi:hypothetical protein